MSRAKASLRARKHRVKALSVQVNDIKQEMDATGKEQKECKRKESSAKVKTENVTERWHINDGESVARTVLDEIISETEKTSLRESSTQVEENESMVDEGKEITERHSNKAGSSATKEEEYKEHERDANEEVQNHDIEEDVQKLLHPLKLAYRTTSDQLVVAKNNFSAAKLVVFDLSAKLHDSFVVWWRRNELLDKKNVRRRITGDSKTSLLE